MPVLKMTLLAEDECGMWHMQEKGQHGEMWVAPLAHNAARTFRCSSHEPETPPDKAPQYFHAVGEYLNAFCATAWLTL